MLGTPCQEDHLQICGTSFDPCGTPDNTGRDLELTPRMVAPLDADSEIVFEPRQQVTADAESVDLLEQ